MEAEATVELNPPESKEPAEQAQDKQPVVTFSKKKRQPQKKKKQNADIVYMKGSSLESLPPLSKQLSTVHDGIIGLMCVWEYRSPSKSVPPHYQCKLCLVSCTQSAMIAHIKSWKHSFKYMKKFHPNKTNWQVEEVTKNSALKNKVKEAALEVEKIEGQGKPRVVLKEPYEVPAFQGLTTALPRTKRKTRQGKGPRPPHFGPRFSDQAFSTEYAPLADPPNYQDEDFRERSIGDYSYEEDFSDSDLRSYPHKRGNYLVRDRDIFGADNGREDYRSGLVEEDQGRPYYDDYRDIEIDREMDGQLDKPGLLEEPQSQNTRSTLLSYLDTFRIENENDAQLVLKVTQKLTDALMDYRLRSTSSGPSLSSSSMNSTDLMNYSSSSMFSNDRYSSSLSGLTCVCRTGYRTVTTDKASITCQQCPTDQPAVTKDGFGCIRCPGSISDDGKCLCPADTVLVERDVNGNFLDEAKCEACNGNIPALSVPNTFGDRCERCQASFINTSCVCSSPNILAGGLCFPPGILAPNANPNVNFAQLKFSVQSAWFVKNLYSSAAACLVFSNLTACQALGNMCVLNMHSFSGVSNDACGLFNTIFRSKAAMSSTHDISYWRSNLPWLYYGDEPGLAGRVLQTDPVPVSFSFRGKNKNTDIKLLTAVYDVGGQFVRWEAIGRGNLQLCPDTAVKKSAALSFGTAYKEGCDLSVADLLENHPTPLFYDVFMDLGGGENRKLLPLPTLVYNQQYSGRFINQESMKNWYLSRRMFVVDTLSGREKSVSLLPKVIRVATSVKIRFQLVPRTQQGQVFPPLMIITYSDLLITDVNSQTVSVTFAVEYEMDQSDARMKTDTALGVLGGLAVLYSLLKTVSWKRRIGSTLIDAGTMFKFLLFYSGDLANVFFVVTAGTGLYWLIFYKAQQFVSVLLPLPAQEEQFVTYIGCAFSLKAIQFLHKLVLQVSVDIFLIDWERPRSKAGRTVQASGDSKRDPVPVSIWRTYFVANEWNEIQTFRKISPTFQIMAVLFFLEVVGFSNLALRDPWSNLSRSSQAYAPSYSLILRYGLATSLWICIGLLQVIFFTVIYEHFFEDKIRQFVDLCSISNISVLLLSHRCFGYYIHGRSVHGHADTNMEEMNNNLKREAESLCGQRGLLPNTDIQTFQVSLTNHLRSHYERIREPLSRRSGPSRLMDTSVANPFEQNIRAYHTMNHFLGSIIDHAHPDMDYIVKDKLMFERVIGMEFLEPTEKSIFYNDEAHSFSNVLFYGNEATLLIFDTLFFCVVDLGSQSFVLAAVLTYVQQMIFGLIRNFLGRKNLVNKTLVDERFLI